MLSTMSTLLNWFDSQTIFFARVITLDNYLRELPLSMNHVWYCIQGILCFTLVAFLACSMNFLFGLRRRSTDMPLVSTCGAALSAACHSVASRIRDPVDCIGLVKPTEIEHAKETISWRVERTLVRDEEVEGYTGYCTFTSREPFPPREV